MSTLEEYKKAVKVGRPRRENFEVLPVFLPGSVWAELMLDAKEGEKISAVVDRWLLSVSMRHGAVPHIHPKRDKWIFRRLHISTEAAKRLDQIQEKTDASRNAACYALVLKYSRDKQTI